MNWTDEKCEYLIAGQMLFGNKWRKIKNHFKSIFLDKSINSLRDKYSHLEKTKQLKRYKIKATEIYEKNKNKINKNERKKDKKKEEDVSPVLFPSPRKRC